MLISKQLNLKIVQILKNGGIGVIPTDTIYGLVGKAKNKKTVERIYKIRQRNPQKPFIILISSLADLKKFDIKLSSKSLVLISKLWPGQVSIILPCPDLKFKYLHRGTKTLAFRLPRELRLRNFLKKTGPLVAPSVNLEGESPAKNLKQAESYFGDTLDFYVDSGELKRKPSKLIKLVGKKIEYLRG